LHFYRIALFLTSFLLIWICNGQVQDYFIKERNGRFGLLNEFQDELIPPIYDDLGWTSDMLRTPFKGVIGYKVKGHWGLITIEGKILTEPVFYSIEPFNSDLIKVAVTKQLSNELEYGLLNLKGKTVQSCEYFELQPLGNHILAGSYQDTSVTYGVLNSEFGEILPVQYQEIIPIQNHFVARDKENLFQVFSISGLLVSKEKFDEYSIIGSYLESSRKGARGLIDLEESKEIFATRNKEFVYSSTGPKPVLPHKWSIRGKDLNTKITIYADSLESKGNLLIGFLNGEQRVYRDSSEILPHKYFHVKQSVEDYTVILERNTGVWHALVRNKIVGSGDSIFFDGSYFLIESDSQWIAINKFGRSITERSVDEVMTSQELYLPVKKRGHWALVDYQGEEILNYAYDRIGKGHGSTFPVKYVGRWGIMNAFGSWLVQPSYDSLYRIAGFYAAEEDNRISILSAKGVHLSVTRGSLIEENGAVTIRSGNSVGIISVKGAVIFDPIYQKTSHREQFYLARREEGSVVKNGNGEFVLRLDKGFEEVYSWQEGFFHIKKGGLHGFVDVSARLRIANRYDSVQAFNEGFAPIKLLGKWGFINEFEDLVIQPVYEDVSGFKKGIAIIRKEKVGLIDKNGASILETEYDNIIRTSEGSYILNFEGRRGLADVDGRVLLSPSFDYLEDIGDELLVVGTGDKKGLYNSNGELLLSFEYSEIKTLGDYIATY